MKNIKLTSKSVNNLDWNFLHLKKGQFRYSVIAVTFPLFNRILTIKY